MAVVFRTRGLATTRTDRYLCFAIPTTSNSNCLHSQAQARRERRAQCAVPVCVADRRGVKTWHLRWLIHADIWTRFALNEQHEQRFLQR